MDDNITTSVRTRTISAPDLVRADICILGAGISGVSAALEAARLGRRVVLVDGAPALGGQAIGSIIGTIIGLYAYTATPNQSSLPPTLVRPGKTFTSRTVYRVGGGVSR